MRKIKFISLIFFSIFCFNKAVISAEIDIYKKIDLFGEVLEKINKDFKFSLGILKLKKGNKQITTTNILRDPKSKGGTFVFKTSFPKTKALPNSAMINKINK